jgi:hypothetical protein
VDPPERDFRASLRERLVAAGPPDPLPRWRRLLPSPGSGTRWLWPAAGLATGVAAFLVTSALRPSGSTPEPARAASVTRLPSTRVALVRVNLSADVAVEAASIRITLPPELRFWADGEELAERTFEWTQPLRAGDNEIPVAVRGREPGTYRIAVSARIGDEVVEEEVVLEVVDG